MRLLQVSYGGGVAFAIPLFRTRSLPRIQHVDFGAEDRMCGDERDAYAASEVGAKARAIVAADAHGAEGRTQHQAATETLGIVRRQRHHQEQ